MSTAEILSKLTPKTQSYTGVGASASDLGWQDILQAMRGVDAWKTSFLFYTYAADKQSRHGFFAGLFMEVMERPETQAWIRIRKQQGPYHRDVETMCVIAVNEWGSGTPYTQKIRAGHMGVSVSTWKRRYRLIYNTILTTPLQWEDEVMRLVTKRLR
jgi:hypothetical protein